MDAQPGIGSTATSDIPECQESEATAAEECKRRMLKWPNPVEYVNNMYGCHPGDGNSDYFEVVFRK